jgi:UDP-apiose/xylose synthase
MNKVAVLGCGGFIGSHLISRMLKEDKWNVHGVDLCSDKISHLFAQESFTFHNSDIHNVENLYPVIAQCDTVISLAALCNPYLYNHTPIKVIESNFVQMYPVIKMCAELGTRLIHFSTSEVYGRTIGGMLEGEKEIVSSDPYILSERKSPLLLGPVHAQRWCYACAKQLLERTIYAYGFERNLDYSIIRPFNFIGSGMDYIPGVDGEGVPRVIACFMDALFRRSPLQLVDGGKNCRCFTAIDDAVDAIMLILGKPEASHRKIFNIGNPENETTIFSLADKMIGIYAHLTETAVEMYKTRQVSSEEFYGAGYEDSDRRIPDIATVCEQVGWQPRISLDTALENTVAGFIDAYTGKIR